MKQIVFIFACVMLWAINLSAHSGLQCETTPESSDTICTRCNRASVEPEDEEAQKNMGKCPIYVPIMSLLVGIIFLSEAKDGGCFIVALAIFFIICSVLLFFIDIDLDSFTETSKYLYEETSYTY